MWVSLSSIFFFFKQKTAYEMRISDWSSDVCSSDLWTPLFQNPRYGILPLVAGTLTTSLVALLVAVPLGTVLAIYLSEFARPWVREEIGRASCRERVCQYV